MRVKRYCFVVAALALFGARPLARAVMFPGAHDAFPDAEILALRAPGARLLRYSSRDGTPLAAALVPRGSITVVYLHATNQSAADALPFAADLAARGISVLVPEHRGYGGLDGVPSGEAIVADARAALDAAGLDPERTVLAGRSLGAAVAARLAEEGRGAALVLLSPFTSIDDVAWPATLALAPSDRFDVKRSLENVRVPVTVVHGRRDRVIPYRMGASLPARLVPLDGVGHNELFLAPWRERILDVIEDAARDVSGDHGPVARDGVLRDA